MGQPSLFAAVLDAVDQLSVEEQQTLLDIVQRRVAERERQRLAGEVREGREEYARGQCTPATVDELLNEVLT